MVRYCSCHEKYYNNRVSVLYNWSTFMTHVINSSINKCHSSNQPLIIYIDHPHDILCTIQNQLYKFKLINDWWNRRFPKGVVWWVGRNFATYTLQEDGSYEVRPNKHGKMCCWSCELQILEALGNEIHPFHVARRIIYLKKRYIDFRLFLATDGISYDADTNHVTVGQPYFNVVNLITVLRGCFILVALHVVCYICTILNNIMFSLLQENPKHAGFHFFEERLYPMLYAVFCKLGFGFVDLYWMLEYFCGDGIMIMAAGLPKRP